MISQLNIVTNRQNRLIAFLCMYFVKAAPKNGEKRKPDMINEAYELVTQFQEMAGQPVGKMPNCLSKSRCEIRSRWMEEEIREFKESINVYEQADAIIDLLYYAIGTLVEIGVKPDKLFCLIHDYNMKKLSVKNYDEDGKVMKPAGWHHPDAQVKAIIDAIILEQETATENVKAVNTKKSTDFQRD